METGSGALPRGSYHAVGIYGPKTEDNVGSLWRSALQMGAAYIFSINARFPLQRLKTHPQTLKIYQFPVANQEEADLVKSHSKMSKSKETCCLCAIHATHPGM